MLIDFKIHDSKRANEILSAIAAKKREIDDLCFELRKCMAVEAELKKFSSVKKGIIDLIPAAVEAVKQETVKKMKLFSSDGRALSYHING